MALEAHPTKTVMVILGTKEFIEKTRKDVKANPTIIQGNIVKEADFEIYLGQKVPTGGRKEYINQNLERKMQKVVTVSNQIRTLLKAPIFARFGKLLAQKTLIVSQVIPTLTYGCQSWLFMNKEQIKKLESIQKKALTIILGLPENTTYEILLHQLGIYHAEQVIHCLKLKFFLNKLHIKRRGIFFKILRREFTEDIPGSFAAEITALCQRYNLPNLNSHYVAKEQITEAVREVSMRKQWEVINKAKHIPNLIMNFTVVKRRSYFKLDSLKSRALLCFNSGNLILRVNKSYSMREKHQGSKRCLFEPLCLELEDYPHFRSCPHYKTKYIDLGDDDLSLSTFLVSRNNGRQSRFGE